MVLVASSRLSLYRSAFQRTYLMLLGSGDGYISAHPPKKIKTTRTMLKGIATRGLVIVFFRFELRDRIANIAAHERRCVRELSNMSSGW